MFKVNYYRFIISNLIKKFFIKLTKNNNNQNNIEQCYGILINFISKRQINEKNFIYLKKKISDIFDKCEELPNIWWLHIFQLVEKFDNEKYKKLITITKELSFTKLLSSEWIFLYSLFLRIGLIEAAFYLREKSEDAILQGDIDKYDELNKIKLAACHFERCDYKKAIKIWSEVKNNNSFYFFKRMVYGQLSENIDENSSGTEYNNHKYAEYLKDKSVAIIGPSKSKTKIFNIDHDVIIKFNQKENLDCSNEKVDVSYYNGSQTEYMLKQAKNAFPKNLVWINLKTEGFSKLLRQNKKIQSKIRVNINPSNYLFNGELNMLPYVISDLFFCGVKNVTIYKNDLMLTKGRPSNYYPDTSAYKISDEEKFRKLSVMHDPITQFRFLYNMSEHNKFFIGDFKKIFEMNTITYMRKLDNLYGLKYTS